MRVRTDSIDRFLSTVGEVMLATSQLRTAADATGRAAKLSSGFDRMDRVVGELQRRALNLRTTRLLRVMENLPRAARDVATRRGKRVEAELRGVELELDRSILDRLYDPLVHLVRNAVDHGIELPDERRAAGKPETGSLVIEAQRDRDAIRIAVQDDGAGIDLEAVRARAVEEGWVHPDLAEDLPEDELAAFVFRPGLSTAKQVSEVSGRGVGMDAVRATIESLGGHVELQSRRGQGTTTTLVVPIAAAVQSVLLVAIGQELVAVPIAKVEHIVEVETEALERSGGECFVALDGDPVLVLDLSERLGWGEAPTGEGLLPMLLCEVRGERVALRVERLAGQQQIYVKPLPGLLAHLRGVAGHTVLGDGRPVFVLELNQLP